jgi:hypothetical protein
MDSKVFMRGNREGQTFAINQTAAKRNLDNDY